MYKAFVLSSLEYANVVWWGSYDCDISKLEKIRVDGMRLVTGATAQSNIDYLYIDTAWQSISERQDDSMVKMLFNEQPIPGLPSRSIKTCQTRCNQLQSVQ